MLVATEEGVVRREFIVIPREDADTLVARVYADPALAAFHGRDRVYRLIASRFVGVNRNAVVDAIRRHEASQVRHRPQIGAMRNPGPLARRPGHIWQVDYTGTTYDPVMGRRVRSILVVVDCFSRYLWAFLVKGREYERNLQGRNAFKVKTLKRLFLEEGAPDVLQADNEFGSDGLREVCGEHNVRLSLARPYHWKAQSVVERFNGLLKAKLGLGEEDRGPSDRWRWRRWSRA